MVVRRARVPEEVGRRRETPEIMTKPLPQILDEMEANIRAAAEAAKRAEEEAKAARGAAGAATTASAEAAKRAEEARQAGESAAETATRAATDAATKAEETARKLAARRSDATPDVSVVLDFAVQGKNDEPVAPGTYQVMPVDNEWVMLSQGEDSYFLYIDDLKRKVRLPNE